MTNATPHPGGELREAIEHLTEYVAGLEIAADCERRIEAAYAPEAERWKGATSPRDDRLNRMMRNLLDARSNAQRIEKDADAIRTVLAALTSRSSDAGRSTRETPHV